MARPETGRTRRLGKAQAKVLEMALEQRVNRNALSTGDKVALYSLEELGLMTPTGLITAAGREALTEGKYPETLHYQAAAHEENLARLRSAWGVHRAEVIRRAVAEAARAVEDGTK